MSETPLLLATTNPGKVREIRKALEGLPLRTVGLRDVLPGLSFREGGASFLENARAKSLFYSRKWKGLTLAEDSGLEIDALGGAPGVRSARFSSPGPTDDKNIRKVLRRLAGVPGKDRGAGFCCAMVLATDGRVIREIRGRVRGRIGQAPRGQNGFGYDPLFFYPPLRKTFAELRPEEKNEVSHRGRALRKLKKFLAVHIKD
ncbi:MAG: RdgB/HAM1 family non-canonical purine NTP pyrophosphatase [Candidatus Aminicenantales bacterium]